jgi:hypothetical protein
LDDFEFNYLFEKWSILQWPVEWYHADILKDITCLEMIPIALSVFLWDRVFKRKKIAFHVDNPWELQLERYLLPVPIL